MRQKLPSHERAKPRLQLLGCKARDGCKAGRHEALAQDRGVKEEAPIRRLEGIQARSDERGQRLGNREFVETPARLVGTVLRGGQLAVRHKHPDRLDGVERHPFGPSHDCVGRRRGQARHHARE